ncbi:MAG: hypothetical protein NVSMB6_09780 [Burkholderiaceae bacterium]
MDMPLALDKLLELIDADHGFAGLRSTLATVATLENDSAKAAQTLAQAILSDAALTVQLMRYANAGGRTGQSVCTIDKALALLGMNKVKAIAVSLPAIDNPGPLADTAQADQLQAEIVAAAFCGQFAAGVTRMNAPRLKAQEAHVCGLLQNMGRILAGHYLYEEIGRSHALQADLNLSEDEAVARTFGIGFDEIGAAVARHWQFPDIVQRSLDTGAEKLPARPLISTLEWHQYCAVFARRITDALFRVPEHQMRAAIASQTSAYRAMLHLKDLEVSELIERSLSDLDASLALHGNGASIRRTRELLRKSSERVTDWLSPQDSLTGNSRHNPRKTRVEIVYQILRSIHDEFHFDMTLLCVPNGSTELVAISGVGRNANQIISRFRCGGLKQDLFRSVASKGMDLYVPDAREGKYAQFLPSWYETLIGARSLYIMSLMHEGEQLGIVYGDYTAPKDAPPDGLSGDKMRRWRNELIAAVRPARSRER